MTGLRLDRCCSLTALVSAVLLSAAPAIAGCAEDWRARPASATAPVDDSGWREVTSPTGWVASGTAAISPEAAPLTAAVSPGRPPSVAPTRESRVARDQVPLVSTAAPLTLAGSELTAAEFSRVALGTATVVVLVMLTAVGWRYLGGRVPRRGQRMLLRLQGSVTLGARNGLHLVQVEDRQFLVAVDGRGVSCVTPVTRLGDDDLPPAEADTAASTATWPLHLLPAGGA